MGNKYFGLLMVLLILFSVGGVCAADTNDTVNETITLMNIQ